MIELDNVSKKFIIPSKSRSTFFTTVVNRIKRGNIYNTIWALVNANINIKKGETVGIIGPNGSGKSTLLRVIADIYKPTSGIVKVKGEITSVLQLGVGFLSDLSLRDNVFLFGTIMGLDRIDISKNFSRIIDFAELGEFINAEVRTLSLGMKERLAFSIVTQACRDILLLDETLVVGDEKFKEKSLKIMNKFKKEGRTIILVSHDLNMVKGFCDRAILLNKGRVDAFGDAGGAIDKYLTFNNSKLYGKD